MSLNPKQIQNFMSKVTQSRNCWIWTGSKMKNGYGVFHLDGKLVLAHRLSYELFRELIPKNLQLDHLCRVRHCVNPDHLEAVTQQENIRRGDYSNNGFHQKSKTHCPQGHPYSEENTYVRSNGSRHCRKCHVITSRNHKLKIKVCNNAKS